MRFTLIVAAAALVAAPALAQTAVGAKAGQTLRDSTSARIGVIDRVNPDGSVQIIVGTRFVTIPADKLAVSEGIVQTSLTKREVAKMH